MCNSIEEKGKICSFYASKLHLTTILMEYIYEKIKEGRKILNVLERDLINEAESVIELFNCKKALKSDIKRIGWNKFDESQIEYIEKTKDEDIVILAGSKRFVEKMKQSIKGNTTVVECYELLDNADQAMEIINSHEYLLMTEGVRKVEEIFI